MRIIKFSDLIPKPSDPDWEGDSLVEIDFHDAEYTRNSSVDTEMVDKVITADCPYGTVTIEFDEKGLLKAIEVC